MFFLNGAWAVFEKDLKLELRSRYAINVLLMFVASCLLLILFAVGQEPLSERVQSTILWIVILFAAAVGLGRAFIAEEERGTVLLLQLNTRPSMVYAGKLFFNFLLILTMNLVASGAFVVLLGISILTPVVLFLTLLLGAVGLAGATTLLGAIIARTSNRGPLLAVLAFPVLVPLLLAVVNITRLAIAGTTWEAVGQDLLTLVAYAGVVITASVLLFEYVWNDGGCYTSTLENRNT